MSERPQVNESPTNTGHGTPGHMLLMMRNMTKHAGETMWAVLMNEAREYFEQAVRENGLQNWRPKHAE